MMKIYILIIFLEINSIYSYNTKIEEIKEFNNKFTTTINNNYLEDYFEEPIHKPSGCTCRHYINENYSVYFGSVLCKRFPREIKSHYKKLRISTTAISVLKKGDLAKNHHLRIFQIEGNAQFKHIEPGAFDGLINLQNLSFAENLKLCYLDKNALKGLVNLKELVLKQNGFLQLNDFIGAANLPKLKKLLISQMLFPLIFKNDFADLANTSINNLGLVSCKIRFIHPKALIIFKKLKTLKLGGNELNTSHTANIIKIMINHSIPIEYLNLNSMSYKELPVDLLEVIAETKISMLSLSGNMFELIGAFPFMPNLKELKLINCLILNITNDAFQSLPKLTILKISHNQFAEIPNAVLLPNLNYLDISNSGQYFILKDEEIFTDMINLKHLHLSENNIRKISNITFTGLDNLEALDLKSSYLYTVEHSAFLPLKNLKFLDLRNNGLSVKTFSRYLFEGLEKLEFLLLGNCKLSDIQDMQIFSAMPNLTYLGLEYNNLKTLPAPILAPLKRLEQLDISMNSFITWNSTILTPGNNLNTLIAYNNKIRNITQAMIEDFVNLTLINLQKNPFACQCDDFDALNSIVEKQKYTNIFKLLKSRRLFCSYPDEYSNLTILEYFNLTQKHNICLLVDPERPVLIIFAIIMLIISAILAFTLYTLKGQIGYLYFLINYHLTNRYKRNKIVSKSNFKYDAFVSYSSEDCAFVEQLVNILETKEPHFKLCVYERDFQIGSEISESVLKSIENSKKILLIVSESFVKSQWCRWEVQVAENKRFFENEYGEFVRNSIIIVRLGHLCIKDLSPMLRYLITTRIYLQFEEKDEKEFWDKLKRALGYKEKRIILKN